MGEAQAATRIWRAGRPVDVEATLGSLIRGRGDPTHRRDGHGGVWRASWTPEGSVLLHVRLHGDDGVEGSAWGRGAAWALDQLPELLGADDDPGGLRPRHACLRRAAAGSPGWRVPRTRRVWEALVPAVLEQRVTGAEAHAAWRRLVEDVGAPAPGPAGAAGAAAGMRLPPTPQAVAAVPSWRWTALGVDVSRRRALVDAVHRVGALERTTELDPARAAVALRSLAGIGVWTAAEIRQRAHGDADAFSWGDYHVARDVCWALEGADGDDARCARVVEEYRGHRYRVQRLVELHGPRRPRRAPRRSLPTHLPGNAFGYRAGRLRSG